MNKKTARKIRQKREKQRFQDKSQIAREKQYQKLVREINLRYPTKEEFDKLKQTTSRHPCEMCGELIESTDFHNEQFAAFAVGNVRPEIFIESEFYFAHRSHFEKSLNVPVENYKELQEQFERKVLKKEFLFKGFSFDQFAPEPSHAYSEGAGAGEDVALTNKIIREKE